MTVIHTPTRAGLAALTYAARGWRVVPIGQGQKWPDLPAWQDAATVDPAVIGQWYTERPGRGVGIATGELSGVFVLDVDLAPGGDETLADLERLHGPLTATCEVITGSGGRHLYYRHPAGLTLGNSAGRLGPGLDVRANGGQVLAPPTLHPGTGQPYAWDLEHHPDDTPVADAPTWLLELLTEQPKAERPDGPRPTFADAGPLARDRFNLHPGAADQTARLLVAHGWQEGRPGRDGTRYFTRPGKELRDGLSATLGKVAPGVLMVFTGSAPPFTAERAYDPFDVLRLLQYDGDGDATARALSDAGWGSTLDVRVLGPVQNPQPSTLNPQPPMRAADPGFFVDWPAFLGRERSGEDWLLDPILARGRAHAFYAGHKTGKSLMLLWAAAKLATSDQDVVVIYLDYEMGEDDLHERIEDMGYGPTDDLTRLRYALLPTLSPLDTGTGGDELLAVVDAEQAAWPDHHLVVIIDTTSRALSGEENSADTIRAFYRETGIKLKQRGVTWARVDHAGKDATKGQRGSSAKGDDVDLVWLVTAGDAGSLILTRKASRMGWVPDTVALTRSDAPLAYSTAERGTPAGTAACMQHLDQLGAPLNVTTRQAAADLRAAGHTYRQTVVVAAVKCRREPRPVSVIPAGITSGTTSGGCVAGAERAPE